MSGLRPQEDPSWQGTPEKGWTLLEFRAQWCDPCRKQSQILQELAKEFELVQFCRADIEAHSELAIEMGVQSVPTLVLCKQGREVQRFIGLQDKETLRKSLKNQLGSSESGSA
ncbi:MAG: thioredoxin family protein [Desulfohalobiaceae bacterium]